ncbi:hypothetical protein H4R18_000165 [Coemansia javaensis]|uniref:Uncharacterized protein n=1 Tax=Coemansia javaensis TaxID=2761396 RepID=A0A9W8LKX4_9FUNG|nr:hypothetical protein H4R18_000165 [Coemansia javaensis]
MTYGNVSYGFQPQVEDHKTNAVKQFFSKENGDLDKKKLAAVSALLLGGGFAVKKTYDHYTGEELAEEEHVDKHEADEHEENKIKAFFTDEDGSLDKSKIAAASALLLGSGFAIKKTYDHYQGEEEQEQQQQPHHVEGASPSRFEQFFRKEDGSVDKSHALAATALLGGLAAFGKKFYEGRQDDD